MGQVPAKFMLPSAPYGSSEGANVLNPVQPGASNPQTPLLPPNFQDPGTMPSSTPLQQPAQQGLQRSLFGGQQQPQLGQQNYSQLFKRSLFGA